MSIGDRSAIGTMVVTLFCTAALLLPQNGVGWVFFVCGCVVIALWLWLELGRKGASFYHNHPILCLSVTFIAGLILASAVWVRLVSPNGTIGGIAKTSSSDTARPTLLSLFKQENQLTFRQADDALTIRWQDGTTLPIKRQLYLDFQERTKFVGFYIPHSPKTYEACIKLATEVQQTIDSMEKNVPVNAGYRDESNSSQNLVFSGRVFLYHEDALTITEKADIIRANTAKNLDVWFRGPDYLGDAIISWDRQHSQVKNPSADN